MLKKVHKVELVIIDFDELGADNVKLEIENVRYPNRCISPHVVSITTKEVDWSDEHPLNKRDTFESALEELFKI